MFAKRFFYVCAGLLCLALSYHFGAQNATAQAPGNPVVAYGYVPGTTNYVTAVTANGDVYFTNNIPGSWTPGGNIFGTPTPTQGSTWGAVKTRYRGERGAAQPTTGDR